MGIPKLPRYEVPAVGYREIRDALINFYGDTIDPERTASEQVIELLREHKQFLEQDNGDWSISCACGWRGMASQRETHHASAGGRSWTDYLCPGCKRGMGKEYDPDPEWDAGRDRGDDE